jgi:hypothetical protein
MNRRAFITLLGGATAAWPLAGKPAFVSMIGLLSSRPPFGRIEPAAEFGPRAARTPRCGITDGPPAHDSPIAPQ